MFKVLSKEQETQFLASQILKFEVQKNMAKQICSHIFGSITKLLNQIQIQCEKVLDDIFLKETNELQKESYVIDQFLQSDVVFENTWQQYSVIIDSLVKLKTIVQGNLNYVIDQIPKKISEQKQVFQTDVKCHYSQLMEELIKLQIPNFLRLKVNFGLIYSSCDVEKAIGYEPLDLSNIKGVQIIYFLIELSNIFLLLEKSKCYLNIQEQHLLVKFELDRCSLKIKTNEVERLNDYKGFEGHYYAFINLLANYNDKDELLTKYLQNKHLLINICTIIEDLLSIKYSINEKQQVKQTLQQGSQLQSLYCQSHKNRLIKYLIDGNFQCFECIVQQNQNQQSTMSRWEFHFKQVIGSQILSQHQYLLEHFGFIDNFVRGGIEKNGEYFNQQIYVFLIQRLLGQIHISIKFIP